MPTFPVQTFHQYGGSDDRDLLLLFVAPAKDLAKWAGVPRKGWHIRMLYQRWITPTREEELRDFWNDACDAAKGYILGPTAITIAIVGEPLMSNGRIDIAYSPIIDFAADPVRNLGTLAVSVLPKIQLRLNDQQKAMLDSFSTDPLKKTLPDVEHDYVFEFAMQLAQMRADPSWFVEHNAIDDAGVTELVTALEAICRPAVVVDGQHRLYGAASATPHVYLPVVAIPRCNWTEQIYQFIIINEKAEPIETSLLTDIFGSSLTRDEQQKLRTKLERAKVKVEERIAAIIAARDPHSPFLDMVKLNLPGDPPGGSTPYVPESTMRQLIEGGRGALGWRSDDEFYEYFISPTFPDRQQWESWTSGAWRSYWFAFWETVRDYYNEEARKARKKAAEAAGQEGEGVAVEPLWSKREQSNLTKAVTLRLFQKLFMQFAIDKMKQVEKTKTILVEAIGEENATEKIRQLQRQAAVPSEVMAFQEQLLSDFLGKGVPVRFFTTPWKTSLDDPQGQEDLWFELQKALEAAQNGRRWHLNPNSIWVPSSNE